MKVVDRLTIYKKRFAPIASILLLIPLLSGCGSGTSSSTASTRAPAAAPTVSASGPSTTEANLSTPTAEPDPLVLQLQSLTLEEKIGQMLLVGINGTTLDSGAKRMITEDKVGGIILYGNNIDNLQAMVKLVNAMKKSNAANAAPLFMSVDQEGGKVSRMPAEYATIPSNAKVGIRNDVNAARTMGTLLAREVRSAGFNMNFAPVLDINSNPKNPVIGDRSFGNSADTVVKLGIAEMKGIESESVIPVVKHFPGHGDTSVDSHLELPVVNKTRDQLAGLEWLPFQAAIKENADAVMVAHILFPKLDPDKPASLSRTIIGDLLREEMGYKGVVITDDLTMGAIMKHFDLGQAALDSVNAGSDILLVAHEYENEKRVREAILQNVKNGKLKESRIDESVYRILALKHKYGLTDNSVPVPDLTALNKDIKAWRSTIAK
ncbi:glycoside hydrolase family 3 [Bacillus sp. FJAT-27264]|uniref:beta-N-acetylhexosaminidase n=1 Tax=Paenibacillus sp. (strain DSM 101736 / FJAT-27264) TaxID=1850362 RepID=UPI000807D0A3|nr:beta-N-acetylhexosaminidase [Bacillus sp. FJAT-27264]OBZ14080.1 glycoside hydrolase family 3 [Bacillus sp. FJAT-27264]